MGLLVLESPFQWIPETLIAFIVSIITIWMLKHERKQRRDKAVKFTTKSLEFCSILCIICGLITNIFLFARNVNGFCHFSAFIFDVFAALQATFMGLYQLSRLYYCFANNQIYSNNGYPKWLFILMIVIPITTAINYSVATLLTPGIFNTKCGINHNYEFYRTSCSLYPEGVQIVFYWAAVCVFVTVLWDLAILLLYVYKIRSFKDGIKDKHGDNKVYNRILSILYKICILTVFYDMVVLICVFVMLIGEHFVENFGNYSWSIMQSLCSFAWSYSMFLMMDYNGKEYKKFLKVIYQLKFYYICCKYRYMVNQQLKILENDKETTVNQHHYETTYTMNAGETSTPEKIQQHDMELSEITVTNTQQ